MYSDHLFNYNQVNTLDKWKTELLLRIKNSASSKTSFPHPALTKDTDLQPAFHEETGELDLS